MEGYPINSTTEFHYVIDPNDNNFGFNINTPEDTIIKDKNLSDTVHEITFLKKEMIDILNHQIGLNDPENSELNYENKEIDDLIAKLYTFSYEFKTLQDELVKADKEFNNEMENTKKNIKMLDKSISFFSDLSDLNSDTVKEITTGIKKLHHEISDNTKLIEAKKKFIAERKKLEKYIYLIKTISKWNRSSATCSICLSGVVDHFINPCGHTFCKNCIIETINRHNINPINENDLYSMRRDDSCCPICRKTIINVKPLFYS